MLKLEHCVRRVLDFGHFSFHNLYYVSPTIAYLNCVLDLIMSSLNAAIALLFSAKTLKYMAGGVF